MAKTYKNGKTKTRRQRKNNKTNRKRYIRGGKDCSGLTNPVAKRMCEKTNQKDELKELAQQFKERGDTLTKISNNSGDLLNKGKDNLNLITSQKRDLEKQNERLSSLLIPSFMRSKKKTDFNHTV